MKRQIQTRFRAAAMLATLGLTPVLITGCADNHEKWKTDAVGRTNALRTSLILPMAQQKFDTGDLDAAERDLAKAMHLDKENPELFLLSGRIALERGQLERAYHLLDKAIQFDPNQAEARYVQGIVLQRWQRYEAAYERYAEAYEAKRDNVSYLLAMCEMLVSLGRKDEAIATLESRLNYFDQNPALRSALGHICYIQNDFEKAARYFSQAQLLDPDNAKISEELARAQISAGQFDEATRTLKLRLDESGSQSRNDLHELLAEAHAGAGRHAEARRVYLKLTRSSEPEARYWIRLGELAWKEHDYGGALAAANRAISLSPDRHEGYLLAGMVWQKRGHLDNSLRNFDRAADLASDDAMPLILRGIALQKAGRTHAAAESYREALRRAPDDLRAQKLLQTLVPIDG